MEDPTPVAPAADHRRVTVAVVFAVATVAALAVSGCADQRRGCDTKVSVDPVILRADGRPAIDLDLSARITAGGQPVADLVIDFKVGWPPDGGISFGSATTDASGTAHLQVPAAISPRTRGTDATTWTKYQAEVALFQQSDQAAKKTCVRSAQAPFHYDP